MKKTLLFALILLLAAGICFAGGNKEKASGEKVWIVATDTVFRPFEIFPRQGDKNTFAVGENRIKKSLHVEAIILPQVTDNTEPDIKPDYSSKALGQLVYTTVKACGRYHETEFVSKLSQRLLGMPVYRFSLTTDLQKNCQYLKKWIQEDLSCTN